MDHSVTCNYTNAYLYLVSVHQMAPPRLRLRISNCRLLLIYLPQKDERLSRPGWLTYSGRFTHISGHTHGISCRSSAGQGKFAGQRPTFYVACIISPDAHHQCHVYCFKGRMRIALTWCH